MASEARRRGIGIDRVSRWMSQGTADLIGLASRLDPQLSRYLRATSTVANLLTARP